MKYTPRHSRLVAVLVAAISASAAIQAQTAAPVAPVTTTTTTTTTSAPANSPEEDVVVLSPFEVQATSDTKSYVAQSTLAGNRLNTSLRDIGSSVTVVTSQFLADTGATDNTSLL
jgi:outer membrane receptor for ferric coprogen and ferric-rhodotorulic acid